MLRYGDGTPFPFEDAFLDMLAELVEACTTMLAATASLDRRRADAEAVLQAIGEEERRLLLFERAVAAVCGASPDGELTPATRAAERTLSAMASAVESSREQLRVISTVKAAAPGWDRTARRVHAAAGRFFSQRLLPDTRWGWAWDASGPAPRAEAATQDPRFRVVFDLEIPEAWRAPVRIDTLAPGLIIHLPQRRWLRAPVETAVPLGRCLLVGARHDDRGRELVIRKPDGSGWRIELPQDGQPSAVALDRRGRAAGTALVSEAELAPLLDAIDRGLATPGLPRHAREVLLDGVSVAELEDTTLAPRALLDAIGPTVNEIRRRSRMPGELTLKRDVADGVREELFVSRASLAARYASLPAEHRRLLDDAGFGRGLTTGPTELSAQLTTQLAAQLDPAAPARPTPPPVLPRGSSPSVADVPAAARPRRETQPLIAVPARPSVPAFRAARPRATPDPDAARRRRDEPTVPTVIVAPGPRTRAGRSSDLSNVVTSTLFPRAPVRRLLTPTG